MKRIKINNQKNTIMKNLVLTTVMVLAFFLGFSKTKSVRTQQLDYVVTEIGIFFPQDARLALEGKFYLNDSGKTLKLKLSDIKAIYLNGREFVLRTVNTDGPWFAKYELMENIGINGDYTVLKRVLPVDPMHSVYRYVLHQNKARVHEVTDIESEIV
jgi:hypothetical protein